MNDIPCFRPRLWLRKRCSTSPRDPLDNAGTSIDYAAKVGAIKTEHRRTPSPERPRSNEIPADQAGHGVALYSTHPIDSYPSDTHPCPPTTHPGFGTTVTLRSTGLIRVAGPSPGCKASHPTCLDGGPHQGSPRVCSLPVLGFPAPPSMTTSRGLRPPGFGFARSAPAQKKRHKMVPNGKSWKQPERHAFHTRHASREHAKRPLHVSGS